MKWIHQKYIHLMDHCGFVIAKQNPQHFPSVIWMDWYFYTSLKRLGRSKITHNIHEIGTDFVNFSENYIELWNYGICKLLHLLCHKTFYNFFNTNTYFTYLQYVVKKLWKSNNKTLIYWRFTSLFLIFVIICDYYSIKNEWNVLTF